MPSMLGILMSVIMRSYSAPSILRLAASPELTVSILWPSRRKAMSSISQIERSSSHTRMLPMRSPFRAHRARGCRSSANQWFLFAGRVIGGLGCEAQTPQAQHESRALTQLGPCPHFALVRLHDLVHDGQAEASA